MKRNWILLISTVRGSYQLNKDNYLPKADYSDANVIYLIWQEINIIHCKTSGWNKLKIFLNYIKFKFKQFQ